MGPVRKLGVLLAAAALGACDPVMGAGSGNAPPASQFLHADPSTHSAVLTLIAGYPTGDTAYNYDGYPNGALALTVPAGWTVQVQCENRSTVPQSCAVVGDRRATSPVDPGWSTPNPTAGLAAGASAAFSFTPPAPAEYRIASLVAGSEASGMWMAVHVVSGGDATLTGSAQPNTCATC